MNDPIMPTATVRQNTSAEINPAAGARNLLENCAGASSGDRLLIVAEDPELGWYDAEAPAAVAAQAEAMGIATTLLNVGGPTADGVLPATAAEAMASHDQTVFFARLGDQARFRPQLAPRPPVMSYARTADLLGSTYGRIDYRAFLDLKNTLNKIYDDAGQIRLTCPLGTDLSGSVITDKNAPEDVSIKRFPLGIYKPLPNDGFSGHVALSRYLVSTGSRSYDPSSALFDGVVFAQVDGTRIVSFDGPKPAVDIINAHYQSVSKLFDIEPGFVHSWHAGMHPGCFSPEPASADPDRWGNTAFQNPRVLHFHTCGRYPPGEISWTIVDPTIEIDGAALWRQGHLAIDVWPSLGGVLAKWPPLAQLFDAQIGDIRY